MSDKFTLRDFFIYIIPGSIWLLNIYFIFVFFCDFKYLNNELLSKHLNNKFLEIITYSWTLIIFAYIVGLLLSSVTKHIFDRFNEKHKNTSITEFADNIKNDYFGKVDYEFIDDFLRIQNIENTWKRYRDLEMIIKHTSVPLCISISIITLKFAEISSICKNAVISIGISSVVIFVYLVIYKIKYLKNERVKELKRILVVWYYNLKTKDSNDITRIEEIIKINN